MENKNLIVKSKISQQVLFGNEKNVVCSDLFNVYGGKIHKTINKFNFNTLSFDSVKYVEVNIDFILNNNVQQQVLNQRKAIAVLLKWPVSLKIQNVRIKLPDLLDVHPTMGTITSTLRDVNRSGKNLYVDENNVFVYPLFSHYHEFLNLLPYHMRMYYFLNRETDFDACRALAGHFKLYEIVFWDSMLNIRESLLTENLLKIFKKRERLAEKFLYRYRPYNQDKNRTLEEIIEDKTNQRLFIDMSVSNAKFSDVIKEMAQQENLSVQTGWTKVKKAFNDKKLATFNLDNEDEFLKQLFLMSTRFNRECNIIKGIIPNFKGGENFLFEKYFFSSFSNVNPTLERHKTDNGFNYQITMPSGFNRIIFVPEEVEMALEKVKPVVTSPKVSSSNIYSTLIEAVSKKQNNYVSKDSKSLSFKESVVQEELSSYLSELSSYLSESVGFCILLRNDFSNFSKSYSIFFVASKSFCV